VVRPLNEQVAVHGAHSPVTGAVRSRGRRADHQETQENRKDEPRNAFHAVPSFVAVLSAPAGRSPNLTSRQFLLRPYPRPLVPTRTAGSRTRRTGNAPTGLARRSTPGFRPWGSGISQVRDDRTGPHARCERTKR